MALKSYIPRLSFLFRNYSSQSEGIKYHGFTYYPRFPGQQDPPYEPAKLFMVTRIKAVKGNPYWEKRILKELGLIGKYSDVAVVKNIPENNARLWKVKHLVKVTPISYPNGFPTEEDLGATYLKENGELIVAPTLESSRWEASEIFEKDKLRLDGEILRRELRMRWLNPW